MSAEVEKLLRLGQTSVKAGRPDEARGFFEKALMADPDSFEATIWLVPLLRRSGELERATCLARKATEIKPQDAAGHSLAGQCLLAGGEMALAIESLRQAIALEPNEAVLHHQLGQALERNGSKTGAADAYRRAIELAPVGVESYVSLGSVLASLGDRAGAAQIHRRAHSLEPRTTRGLVSLARAEIEERTPERAEEHLREAISRSPAAYAPQMLLGSVLRQLGRFEEAAREYERAIELSPQAAPAYCEIVYCRRVSGRDRRLISAMEEIARRAAGGDEAGSRMEFALGKAYDDLSEFEAAKGHFETANSLAFRAVSGNLEDGEVRFSEPPLFDLSKEVLDSLAEVGFASERPVFVVGMMRSGTTLMEQMLGRHEEISGAGELAFWGDRTERCGSGAESLMEEGHLRRLGEEYCGQLEGRARYAVDKMPFNYRRLGVIRASLPKARVIHMRRDARDTCISIYMTPNRTSLPFAYDRGGIADEYGRYLAVMEHWRRVLPEGWLMEVEYEELVTRPEETMRQILGFLDLGWDERCVHPEDGTSAVQTPSQWQVRQRIYASSVGRWNHYPGWFEELKVTGE